MDENKTFNVIYPGILAIFIIKNVEKPFVERYAGFCQSIVEKNNNTWMRFYNVSDADAELVKKVITDLVEDGFTLFPEGE